MFIFLEKKRQKLSRWLKKKTTIDFSDWSVLFLFLLGLLAIFYLAQEVKISDKISAIILWFTAIAILQYTKETYWLKQAQNKQINEVRKNRYLDKMPMVRLLSMDVEKKPLKPNNGVPGPDIEDEYFYRIIYKNIGEDWAFINDVKMWVGNLSVEEEIIFEPFTFRKTLFKNEEDTIVTYDAKRMPGGAALLYPRKLKIIFSDRFGNIFTYKADRTAQLAEPTPYLGIRDYIKEEIEYPSNLK